MNIIISSKNIELLNTLYIENRDLEVGGVLLGKKQKENYIITDIVYNYNKRNLKGAKFVRNISDLKDIMAQSIIESNYEIDYIGEWHTHPNFKSVYSYIDKRAMMELNKDFPEIILLIKGKDRISAYLFAVSNIQELIISIKEDV